MSDARSGEIDPQLAGRFRFDRHARVASAGSCFALRIADALRAGGFTYLVTEPGSEERNFNRFSARFGEIYTTLQLTQTIKRALGLLGCAEPAWTAGGRFHDPYRPRIEPGGFGSLSELEADRQRHFAAIERMLRESDVFIFTLGLTETWCSRIDGSAFPLCPGAGIGTFSDERHTFRNLDVDDNVAQLEEFLALARSLNPGLRVILTVSPVPLAATVEPQHVIAASVYSKSVLRVAAETIRRRHANVDYFASYELVTANPGAAGAFGPDGREVTASTVARVMHSFFAAFTEGAPAQRPLPQIDLSLGAVSAASPRSTSELCNEDYLATFAARARRP